ncbi:AlbA family DNA-binding domain-containing protein [Brevibacillus sp. VP]|uniref:AlbA family DNA-binding domain-containing protein n=1 Tax=unclassified Brevibacillus TaxID=2684853 RepID=UPI000E2F97CC|nr:ATP-binding protein [Brevibacillus sp. VP]RFB35442.1 ATP-binding protein [Brevibacillus sp. VP]
MYNSLDKLYELVEKGTENNKWDYKRDIHLNPNNSFANLLKDILAFANSGGGWLVLGVDDNCSIQGVENKIDPTSLGQKILSITGEQIIFDLNYYNIYTESEKIVGLLYVHDSEKVLVSPVNLNNDKGKPIVSENTVYYRRNASSIKANIDDLNSLIYKISQLGKYEFKKEDIKLIENKKSEYALFKEEADFYKGEFEFSVAKFADKLNTIFYFHQTKYTKYEIGILLGFEVNAIDDYFEGKRFPKLEHLLRAVEIFDLPYDYFFQTTINMNKPFIQSPLITYVILEKTEDKLGLFKYGFGKAVQEIFYDTAKEFAYFKKWLYCDKREKLKPEEDEWSRLTNQNVIMYENYERYLENVSESSYNKFKKHLSTQYYKEIERTPDVEERYLNEKIITNLTYSDTDFVCKFISELIRSIHIIDGKLRIEHNFIYEVQNKLIRYRTYDEKNMKVIFSGERTLDE